MINRILEDENFILLMQQHCYNMLSFLIYQNTEFSIVVNTEFTSFNPPLPEHLDVKKNPYVLFALGGYTFESIKLEKDSISFHAGFGPDDFATFVNVDLAAITQIQVENNVLFVNFALYKGKQKDKNATEKSMNIFLNNPKNKDNFKK